MLSVINLRGILDDGYAGISSLIQPIRLTQNDGFTINFVALDSDGYTVDLRGGSTIMTIVAANSADLQPAFQQTAVLNGINTGYFTLTGANTSAMNWFYTYEYDIVFTTTADQAHLVPVSPCIVARNL